MRRSLCTVILVVSCSAAAATAAVAQQAPPTNASTHATLADPAGRPPQSSHIPFVLPKDLKWTGDPTREESVILYGDPAKAGPYGMLIKWHPGAFSRPHVHDHTRWVYVVSGTWWVSSNNVYDEKTTYPFHAGTFATDVANTVHWDGCRSGETEPAVILLTGIGPVKTTQVGENGRPLAAGQ
jgi:hypothetical protein